jgi:hypothetical protein
MEETKTKIEGLSETRERASTNGNGGITGMLRKSSVNEIIELEEALFKCLGETGRVSIRNFSEANFASEEIRVLAVLCPLYAKSSLGDSELIQSPKALYESRVGVKFQIYADTAKVLGDFASASGRSLVFEMLFADTGVLLRRDPMQADFTALGLHRQLYEAKAEEAFRGTGISFRIRSFSELAGQPITRIPGFIKTHPDESEMPKAKHIMYEISNELESMGIIAEMHSKGVKNSIIGDMINMNGATKETIKGLVETYIASELSFRDILGSSGIFVNAERFSPLLRMPDMLKALDGMQRIDVLI